MVSEHSALQKHQMRSQDITEHPITSQNTTTYAYHIKSITKKTQQFVLAYTAPHRASYTSPYATHLTTGKKEPGALPRYIDSKKQGTIVGFAYIYIYIPGFPSSLPRKAALDVHTSIHRATA